MPHGRLTPLGRQLRCVLANLSHRPLTTTSSPSSSRSPATKVPHPRSLHWTALASAQAVAAAYTPLQHDTQSRTSPEHSSVAQENGRRFREHGWRRLKRRKRVDHLSEALRDTGNHAAAPKIVHDKLDLSHTSPRSCNPVRDLAERQRRHEHDSVPLPADSEELSLQRILASYIRHQAESTDYLSADWETLYELSSDEADFLRHKGVSLDDVAAWASIATSNNALSAAELLFQRTSLLGPESVPTFVYLNLLRREYIPAKALRLLIRCTFHLFDYRARRLAYPSVDRQPVLLVVIRLLRHAREVWPQVMRSIVQFMLQHLEFQESKQAFTSTQLRSVTYMLNKLMSLVSYSTASNPFKDNPYQERAVISVLRYMAEHKPPMHIDRQGYRAVVRIQMSQRKSSTDQQWAELKALSWPPWKHDRTAMDATVGLDYGNSRAANTLARMREAGYRMLHWEKTAHLYTGWDIDRTPTIQMRALFQQPGRQLSSMVASDHFTPWAARIASTRTIQEAWACYLAWEDAKLPHDQNVYLEILRKLYHEERRSKHSTARNPRYKVRKTWPLLPGDTPDVFPLPPSTHLYTYTRTVPPSLDSFYNALIGRGVIFEDYCLGFLVQHAYTLQSGLQRLQSSIQRHPGIERLLYLDSSANISDIPLPVFKATLELLARFAGTPMPLEFKLIKNDYQMPSALQRLNLNNTVGRAIELLRSRPVSYRPLWNAVLDGLTRERNFVGFRTLFLRSSSNIAERSNQRQEVLELAGAMSAYEAHGRVLWLLREHKIHLDSVGFRKLCLATENGIAAAWAILQKDMPAQEEPGRSSDSTASSILKNKKIANHLQFEFKLLVGQDQEDCSREGRFVAQPSSSRAASVSVSLPSLLTIPGPATLHAYVRALGWAADYSGLLETVRWMREHTTELAERRSHDRLGEDMMRKTLVALRVFLERSWLDGTLENDDQHPALLRVRTPASPEVIRDVQKIVEDVEGWDGWASIEEVEMYTSDKRFERAR